MYNNEYVTIYYRYSITKSKSIYYTILMAEENNKKFVLPVTFLFPEKKKSISLVST